PTHPHHPPLPSFPTRRSSDLQRAGLYRVGRDGSALAHIGDDTSHFGVDYFAAPSHDGQSVAYSSTRSPCGVETCIRVLDIATNRDRKSTRLNSSHVAISYAVF